MDNPDKSPGLESIEVTFEGRQAAGHFAPVLVGVVGSGNLEVLVEPTLGMACRIEVTTSARGFDDTWRAVLAHFHAQHPYGGLRVSIHDMGATPAVVGLRLAQAVAALPAVGNDAGGAPC